MAHATDPVGPAHVNSGAVVATAPAPYAIATPETGDTTNVVSASYVKGAYNDAIAAINNVNENKQIKMIVSDEDIPVIAEVIGMYDFEDHMRSYGTAGEFGHNTLITADAVSAGITGALAVNGVSAVTVWGDDNNATVLDFVPKN